MSVPSNNSENTDIYDIICYYKEDSQNHNDNVHRVVEEVKKAERREMSSPKKAKWKLLGCLIINVLLSSPIYSHVSIYINNQELIDEKISLIWVPIIFNSTYLLVTPWLFNTLLSSTSSSSNSTKLTNRNVIIIFTLVMSLGISIAGFTFTFFNANVILIYLLYGVIGGMSQCIILGKVFIIINGILKNERLFLINFIYSLAQATTLFIYPIMIHFIITKWNCFDCAIVIMGACLLHIIPFTMLIARNETSNQLGSKRKSIISNAINLKHHKKVESRYEEMEVGIPSNNFFPEIKYPSDVLDMNEVQWKNPATFTEDVGSSKLADNVNDDHFLEILDSHRYMNSDGVEILETITEIPEEEEMKVPQEDGAENGELTQDAIDSIYEEISRKHNMQQHKKEVVEHEYMNSVKRFFANISQTIENHFFNPMRQSIKFYSSIVMKSIDIFSFILFITFILPNQTAKVFGEYQTVIYLITLMGLCWIIYALAALKFHKALKQNCIQYLHFIGLLVKFFGYLFTNQRYSLNMFILGVFFVSFGHANSFHLQETVIRNCFHPRKWYYTRGPIYSVSGLLILLYCIIFHSIYYKFCLVTFMNTFVLLNLCGIIFWLLTNYEMLIYIFNK